VQSTEDIDRFFVVTGGPGSGKTALIEALRQTGYQCTVEAGRAIIQDQMLIGGRALPWDDRSLFAELMLSWEMRSYRIAQEQTGIVFFDRGVADVLGYLQLIGFAVPVHIEKAVETFRYHRRVFIAPPWEQIFCQDGERKQSFDEAIRTYDAMVAAYSQYGYELLELPRTSVKQRLDFVLQEVAKCRI
jgi:predicted ATPase